MKLLSARKRAEAQGRRAEHWAALYLRLKGYHIVTHRMKNQVGEVDLIARRGSTIIFAEVKWRQNFASALQAVTPHTQYRIVRAASLWIAQQPQYHTYNQRFDVIALVPWRWPAHVKGAFDAKSA